MDQELSQEEIAAENQKVRDEVAGEVYSEDALPAEIEVEQPVVAAEVDPDKAPEKEPEPDEWEGVSPALRKHIEGMGKQLGSLGQIETRLKETVGRVGSIQSELARQASQAVKPVDAPAEVDVAAAETDEEWDKLKEDFPEWGNALEKKIASATKSIEEKMAANKPADEKVETPEEQAARIGRIVQHELVEMKHPRYQDMLADEKHDFWPWLRGLKDPDLIEKSKSTKASDAIQVFDAYKKSKEEPEKETTTVSLAQKKKERLAKSVKPQGSVGKKIKSADDMTDQEVRAQIAAEVW